LCSAIGAETPPLPAETHERGQALFRATGRNERPEIVTLHPPAA